jgi:hypothetical protein
LYVISHLVTFLSPGECYLARFTTGFTHNPTTAGCITEIQMEYPEGKSYSVSMTNEYKKIYHSAIVIHLPDSHPITVVDVNETICFGKYSICMSFLILSPSCRLENVIWLRRNCSNVVISFTLPERPS